MNFQVGKKRRGFGLLDLGLYAIALSILVGAGVMAFSNYQDGNKRAVAKQEIATLAQACSLYQVSRKDGAAPANLGNLYGTAAAPAITAANSSDGVAKVTFVAKTGWDKTAASYVDPWGVQYAYSQANQTVSFTEKGVTHTVKF